MKQIPHLASSDAARILKRVKPEYSFKLHSGSDVDNLQGLLDALRIMSDSTFKYHVTKDRNDFSSWIIDVIGDEELAESIRNLKNKQSMIKEIENRMRFLESISSESRVSAFFMRHAILEFALGLLLGIVAGLLLARMF